MTQRTIAADIQRRLLPGAALAGAFLSRQASATTPPWSTFKARFLQPDGRILDTGNGGVSHSEGQGWGMLVAAANDDREAFDRIWSWTTQTLRRPDGLHSWRFRPGAAVDDPNNATDGDLYIALALVRAAARWDSASYRDSAAQIARAILGVCTVTLGDSVLLLPGAQGFSTTTHVTINPSYFVFPAFQALAAIAPDPRWSRLERNALQILDRGRFGTWALPPDWLSVHRATGRLQLADNRPPRFGFDAVRIPLLLAWGRHHDAPANTAARRFWSSTGANTAPPAWVDLRTAEVAPYPASSGVRAIARLIEAVAQGQGSFQTPNQLITEDYYASMLGLLAGVAAVDLNLVRR
ncbi:glycosyl hydrolase family 8 [Plastoroseomonas arctica]|uniref:glycosyl hydrolase family 8 n=1 Tax=Plastoroseomonas arctica TaxID=1509237 RepID=UPI001BAC9991|nr:glycosyl hydrolase family 8 [Plastoroseomonas arctica]